MNYGFILYTGGDIHTLPALAAEAEETGWDGVFYWDGIYLDRHAEAGDHVYDPWVVLAAFAMRTERVRIGALLTPLPRRRPWKVARESVSVDHLSRGRLVLPVGMGFLPDGGFSRVGEGSDARTRAERLDESLAHLRAVDRSALRIPRQPLRGGGDDVPTAAGAGPPHTDPGAGSLAPCHPV